VDPPRSGGPRLVVFPRKLGRPEQEAYERGAGEENEKKPLQRGREGTRPS